MNTLTPQTDIDVRDPQLAQHFLYFYLFETWEKILQTSSFVNQREHRRSRRNWAIINNFLDYLDHLTKQLDSTAVPFLLNLTDGKKFLFRDFIQSIIDIKNVLSALFTLHEQLNFLSGRIEIQGAYDFIRKLEADSSGGPRNPISWLQHNPSIALTDKYDFIQQDFGKILSARLDELGLQTLVTSVPEIVLTLPKSEVDDPLMWAILTNQIAHLMIEDYRILEAITAQTEAYTTVDRESQYIYCNWAQEICSDLIALRLLGPSYFFSFVSMEILRGSTLSIADYIEPIERIGIMANVIEENRIKRILKFPEMKGDGINYQDLTSEFLNLAMYKEKLWSLQDYSKLFQYKQNIHVEKVIKPNVDLIVDILKRARVPTTKINSDEEINWIFNRFLLGQPVSSIQTTFIENNVFLKKLQAVNNPEQLYELLPPPEEPLTISSILYCGWFMKIYKHFPDLKIELVKERALLNVAGEYSKNLSKRNELLQRSLSHSYMMQVYWRWRDYEDEDK
jgi:hypothetical protein